LPDERARAVSSAGERAAGDGHRGVDSQPADAMDRERTDMAGYLDGKVVVVTGGARGIGREVCLLAAAEGAKVVVADYGGAVDSRSQASTKAADEVVAEIEKAGGQAVAVAEDVSTMDGGRNIVQAALDTYGQLDGMVTSAGIMSTKYLWELEEQEWDDVIAVHLKGHFSCFQAASRVMIEQGHGNLVSISSGAAFFSPPNLVAYSAAKGGVVSFTYAVAHSLERYGISVNCVVPSAATRMSDKTYGDADMLGDKVGETIRSELAEGTYRDPKHIAPTVVFLLGDDAKNITAQVFKAQGYEINHLGPTIWDKSMTQYGGWDLEKVRARLPQELGPLLRPLPIPWPERKDH
jgi:NAD(P)-dependent dehydrogenase (short-subunit alcohol dehydrogenase family)